MSGRPDNMSTLADSAKKLLHVTDIGGPDAENMDRTRNKTFGSVTCGIKQYWLLYAEGWKMTLAAIFKVQSQCVEHAISYLGIK